MTSLTGTSMERYTILEQIGEGGMATVYRAYDTHLERDVAIKFIRPDRYSHEETEVTIRRFQREALLLAKLSHPNILTLLDSGNYEGQLYIVTSFINGESLKSRLGKPIPWQEAVHLLLPIARALEYAHSKNILHRDIKPSNILLPPDRSPILVDFGIAKALEARTKTNPAQAGKVDRYGKTVTDVQSVTRSDVGIGTPEYMAPEQGKGKADRRSDIYSLAVVLYELVTGRKPFIADTPLAVLLMHITDPLPLPRTFVPDLPVEVERILVKALAKLPEDRYQNMSLFVEALEDRVKAYENQVRARALKLEKEEAWDEAVKAWHEVLTLQPKDGDQIEAHITSLQSMTDLDRLYQEARSAMAQKLYARAVKLLRQIIARNASFRDAASLLTQAVNLRQAHPLKLEKEGKWEEALKIWQEMLEDDPQERTHIEARIERISRLREVADYYNQAKEALKKKDDVAAARLLKEVIARDETYKDALVLLSQVTARRSKEKQHQRRRRVWVSIGISAGIVILAAILLLMNPSLPASMWTSFGNWVTGQEERLTPVPTALMLTPAPTKPPAVGPTADEIRSFADPILASIADLPPTYQDDFSDPSSGWPQETMSESFFSKYRDGGYVLASFGKSDSGDWCMGAPIPGGQEYSDFVFEVDATILQTIGVGDWTITYRWQEDIQYGVNIGGNGSIYIHKNEAGVHIPLTNDVFPTSFVSGAAANKLVLIAQGSRMALYLNGEPVQMLEDASSSHGTLGLVVCNSGQQMEVMFDNLKIWDLGVGGSETNSSFPLAGTWLPEDGQGSMTFETSCTVGEKCGVFDLPSVPCSGTFTLVGYVDGEYEFSAGDMVGSCGADLGYGPGRDFFELLPDGSLQHTLRTTLHGFSYESTGIMTRISGSPR